MGKVRAFRSDGPVIDIHCHRECAPAAEVMADAAKAAGKVALGHGNPTTQAVNRRQLETIKPKMEMLDVRIADMDRMGVDVQAVAVAVYQYYYWADPELGAKVARLMNEEFVEATAQYPGRFQPLGTVPLQDTEAAIQELRYLGSDLGMRGIEIGTHVEGEAIVHIDGITHSVSVGDTSFVTAEIRHYFENASTTEMTIFWTCSSVDATRTIVATGVTTRIDEEHGTAPT